MLNCLGMLLILYLKWILLAAGGVCLWVALGAECFALAALCAEFGR